MNLLSPVEIQARLAEGHVLVRSALTFQGRWRVGLFARDGLGLAAPPLLDGFVESLPPGSTPGGWNASFALGFTHAWFEDGGWTCIGADGAPLAWLRDGTLHTPEGSITRPQAVRLFVAPGWEFRQVSVLGPYSEVVIAGEEDAAPSVDPAYDRDLLSADLAWLEQLGGSLAEAMGGTFEVVIEDR